MHTADQDEAAPLILTLAFEHDASERFNDMRRRHFPAARNFIPAHLTLFHKLPGQEEAPIANVLRSVSRHEEAMLIDVTGIRFLGGGSAYEMKSKPLMALRRSLAAEWSDWLSPQDAQGFSPHVTIQNKVPAEAARALADELRAAFTPFQVLATGLLLWRYRGGPWEAAGEFPFKA